MKLPRPRFALRWLMAVVAMVAIVAWGWRLMKLREDYRSRATKHAEVSDTFAKFKSTVEDTITSQAELIPRLKQMAMPPNGTSSPERSEASRALDTLLADTEKSVADLRERLTRTTRVMDYHTRLRVKYERLSRYPWLHAEADPPPPE
jgi:hypothetical protein